MRACVRACVRAIECSVGRDGATGGAEKGMAGGTSPKLSPLVCSAYSTCTPNRTFDNVTVTSAYSQWPKPYLLGVATKSKTATTSHEMPKVAKSAQGCII